MSKRHLSDALIPPAKRIHASGSSAHHSPHILSFDDSLYDELILCIFSHLSWVDLCTTQATSRNWARLAADNELWRAEYLKVYGRTRLRGTKGFIGRLDGREVRPLPGRAKLDQYKDWKWMFRISSNWRTGRCLVEESAHSAISPPSTPPEIALPIERRNEGKTHVLLAGPLIITATSNLSELPTIMINGAHQNHSLPIPHSDASSAVSITTLALDQSPPSSGHLSLACFLCTGEFSVFQFNHTSPSKAVQKYTYRPLRRNARTQNIIHAVYYHPLLATLSEAFSLCIYDLTSGVIQLTQTLSSFTSYPPASLVLSSLSTTIFKLVIAYSVPVYPNHWSIGATELLISKASGVSSPPTSTSPVVFSLPSFREDYKYPLSSDMTVISSRTIRAFDVPPGWVDEASLHAMREQWSRKLVNVADTQTDGKWVILAPGGKLHATNSGVSHIHMPSSSSSSMPSSDFSSSSAVSSGLHSPTSLQLYRLILPTQSNSISASPPKLNFVRMLHGQTGPVSSLALADGRCVSLGQNGSIWVWDLEGGTGAEVAPVDESCRNPLSPRSKGVVSFDERRIVTAFPGKVVVRRFDI